MSLEDLANLGEAVGSIGLLISIVFLILELRWNRRESHRVQREDAFQAAMDLELTLFTSDTWHQIWEKWLVAVGDYENGISIDDLKSRFSDSEMGKLSARLFYNLYHLELNLKRKANGTISKEEWDLIGPMHQEMVTSLALKVVPLERLILQKVKAYLNLRSHSVQSNEQRKRCKEVDFSESVNMRLAGGLKTPCVKHSVNVQ